MPADAALIVVNPTASGGRARRLLPWLRETAERAGHELAVTASAGDAERLASAGSHARVIAVGGDGTVQEIVNGLAATQGVALGIVPAGAGNDLARALGLPRETRAALAVALEGPLRAIDAGEATDGDGRSRRFAAAGGTGFDAEVAHAMARQRASWQRGRLGYLLSTLDELRRYRNRRLHLSWVDAGGMEHGADLTSLFVAFANGAYYGGGMRIAPGAALDDGVLDLCIVGDISRAGALRQLPGIYRGRHVGHRLVRMARARRLRIDGDGGLVHLDGEPFGQLPLEVVVHPAALSVATADGPAAPPATR